MTATRRQTAGYGPSIPKPKNCRPMDFRKESFTSEQLTRLLYIILRWRETLILAKTTPVEQLWDENERMSQDPDGSAGGVNKPFGCHITTGKHIIMRMLREVCKDAVDIVVHNRYRQGAEE